MAARDLTLHISSKLAGEWSAPNVAGMLTAPVLEYLVSKWSDLDTMVKTRLLLAPLAMKGASLEELRPQLQAMVEAGVADKDEWVRVMALAVGPYDGRVHLGAVAADFKLVGKTLDELVSGLREADPLLYRPQEELYLHPDLVRERQGIASPAPVLPHRHFRARPRSEAPTAGQGLPSSAAPGLRPPGAAIAPGGSRAGAAGPRSLPRPAADIFISRPAPTARPRAGLAGAGAGQVRRTATLDIAAVAALNQQAAAERERKAQVEREAREALARRRAEERAAERAAAKAEKDAARLAARRGKEPDDPGKGPSLGDDANGAAK
ncbi:hypothetical protein ACKKBG_A16520 [Auxenochlorella protothecoides x Auxenochlorella symbiontica]